MKLTDLNYSTVRIVAKLKSGGMSTGTGFIIKFAEQVKNGQHLIVPSIVTNKHVIEDAEEIRIRFHASNSQGVKIEQQCQFTVPTTLFFMHPDSSVDLCAMPIAELYKLAENDDIKPYYHGIRLQQIPKNNEDLKRFLPSEDIMVVGYPNGLWDELNNLPIFRKGTLATAPAINYNGNNLFLIDCAIYPGSSGSPVLSIKHLFNKETFEPVLSIELLGVVFATYQHTVQGNFAVRNIPTNIDTLIPNHLGLVINSIRIRELNKVISDYYAGTSIDDIYIPLGMKNKN